MQLFLFYHTDDTIHASVYNALPIHLPHKISFDMLDKQDDLVFDAITGYDDLQMFVIHKETLSCPLNKYRIKLVYDLMTSASSMTICL